MIDEDPHDDWTAQLRNLPSPSDKSTEHPTERVAGGSQPSDNKRKKPPEKEGR